MLRAVVLAALFGLFLQCWSHTIWSNGRMVVCTTCCSADGSCVTQCNE